MARVNGNNDALFVTDHGVPTKISDLENDVGYITLTNVPVWSVDGQTGDIILAYANTTVQGVVRFATDSEASDGTSETKVINPKQLKAAIDSLGTVFNLKGSVATPNDLPTTNNKIGDVYYVISESVGYIWMNDNGTNRWEKFGQPIDLSGYVPTSRKINNKSLTDDITLNKSDVGLSNVDNTSDANKPISSATQTALNNKVNNSTLNNYVQKTTTVNNKALSNNISLSATDVGALPNVNAESITILTDALITLSNLDYGIYKCSNAVPQIRINTQSTSLYMISSQNIYIVIVNSDDSTDVNNKYYCIFAGYKVASGCCATDTNISFSSLKVDTTLNASSYNAIANKTVNNAINARVPNTRKINNITLNADVNLTASDVGALPDDTDIVGHDVNNLTNYYTKTQTDNSSETLNEYVHGLEFENDCIAYAMTNDFDMLICEDFKTSGYIDSTKDDGAYVIANYWNETKNWIDKNDATTKTIESVIFASDSIPYDAWVNVDFTGTGSITPYICKNGDSSSPTWIQLTNNSITSLNALVQKNCRIKLVMNGQVRLRNIAWAIK